MLLRPQSCLLQHTGVFAATAAVRNDRVDLPAFLLVSYKQPRQGLPVVGLHNMSMSMRRGSCVGHYTLYTADWTIPGGISFASKIDVISGAGQDVLVDSFIDAIDLPGTCASFQAPPEDQCESVMTATPVPTPTTSLSPTARTTMLTVMSIAAMPVTSTASPTSGQDDPGLGIGRTCNSVFECLTNYFVNYFFG